MATFWIMPKGVISPSTATDIFGFSFPSFTSRSLKPVYCESRLSMTCLRFVPSITNFCSPSHRFCMREGTKTIGMTLFSGFQHGSRGKWELGHNIPGGVRHCICNGWRWGDYVCFSYTSYTKWVSRVCYFNYDCINHR
jgi:hypothetical protein